MRQVYLTLGAIVRDQGRYVKEWLAFHRLIGVERFVIALHKCSDDTKERILELPFVKDIELYEITKGDKAQMRIYRDIHNEYGNATRWMLFLDSDEFMFGLKHDDLRELLESYEEFSSLTAQQRMFGHSNKVWRPDGRIENFIWATNLKGSMNDRAIKTIYQPKSLRAFYSPHFQICEGWQVREDKNTFIVENHCHSREAPLSDIIRYNHYYTGSMEDYLQRAARGTCNDFRFERSSYDVEEFVKHGMCGIVNEDILRFALPLRKMLGKDVPDISARNVKVLTWADGPQGKEMSQTVIQSGRKQGILVEPVTANRKEFVSQVKTKILDFRAKLSEEKKKGRKYLLCVDGRDSVFVDDRDTLISKLQLMYRGGVLVCSDMRNPWPFREEPFPFLVAGKYTWEGFANPCVFFGETDAIIKFYDQLIGYYYRMKNRKPESPVERYILKTHQFNHPEANFGIDVIENVQFLFQLYQADGRFSDLQVDVDRRIFASVMELPEIELSKKDQQIDVDRGHHIGSSCIVHAPIQASSDALVKWATERGVL